jgi:hypothetical protein
MKALSSNLLFCLAFLISGCAQTAATQTLEPAEISGTANTRNIAIVPFHNDYADLTGKIEASIAKQELDGEPWFTLSDRSSVEKVISQKKLKSGDEVDASTAVKLGKVLRAQAVISGTLNTPELQDNQYDTTRTKCTGKGKERRCWEVKVSCKKRTIALSADIRMVDVVTAELLYADRVSRVNAWHVCADDSHHTLPSKKSAVQSFADDIARDFVNKLTPHYRRVDPTVSDKPGRDGTH